jgi:hypothetical protein
MNTDQISSPIKKAKRQEAFLKLGLSGPSGSGKTYSALLMAKGLVGDLSKVVVLDTENGSANLYSSLGEYSVLPFSPPFNPQRYVKAIDVCVKQGFKCIIIDSISHEWDGVGGCLDLHTQFGGKFQDWAKVTPLHKAFIDAILQSKAHVICTMRRKQEFAMVEKNGRMVVEKMGTKEVQRDGFEYELTINFDVNMEHLATPSKDRTNLFSDGLPFKISEATGQKIAEWNNA